VFRALKQRDISGGTAREKLRVLPFRMKIHDLALIDCACQCSC
jgi:hypothetical protein